MAQTSIFSWKTGSLLMLILSLLFCGPKKIERDPTKQSDSQLYQLGMAQLEHGNYQEARETFRVVFESFPKSDYRILAKLAYADCFYLQDGEANLLLAIQEYQDFITLFPFSPKAAYAQSQIGMCYFLMKEKPDRDQTNTRKALDEFKKVIDNYPTSGYYQPAYKKLLECYSLLAEHDVVIAHFYQKTGRHQAAVDRLKGLLKTYPESVYQPKYYFQLAKSLEKLGHYNESCTFYDSLLHKWPNSEFTADAKKSMSKVCKESPAKATP